MFHGCLTNASKMFQGILSFLAAMSSSRSDVVTQCVRVSVCMFAAPFFLVVSFSLVLKSFNGVSRMFKGCLKFIGSFKNISKKF